MKIVLLSLTAFVLLATGVLGNETIRGMATTPYEETFFDEELEDEEHTYQHQDVLPPANRQSETLFRGGNTGDYEIRLRNRILMSKGDSDMSAKSDKSDKSSKSRRRLSKSDKSTKSDGGSKSGGMSEKSSKSR
jgi:hypothetical protein